MLQYLKEMHSDAEREDEEVRFKFDKSCEYILLQLGHEQNGWIVLLLITDINNDNKHLIIIIIIIIINNVKRQHSSISTC